VLGNAISTKVFGAALLEPLIKLFAEGWEMSAEQVFPTLRVWACSTQSVFENMRIGKIIESVGSKRLAQSSLLRICSLKALH
jgi:hypothetical protein